MKVYAKTEKGLNKIENEDRIIICDKIINDGIFETEFFTGILAVADGVGGNNAGAVASNFVAKKISDLKEINFDKFISINDELLQFSLENNSYNAMATTLTGIMFSDNEKLIFNVGNSRIYLLQGHKYLKQLTHDDTTLNYLLANGMIENNDIENFDRKNEITACFGGGNKNLLKLKLDSIDTHNSPIMMTSDGIHDYIDIDKMEEIISEFGLSIKACEAMIKEARLKGSTDDVSILLGDG